MMTLINLPRLPMTFACTITWAFVSFATYPSPAGSIHDISSSVKARSQPPKQAKQNSPDYSDVGRPGSRTGGGSRGDCPLANPKLPDNQKPTLTALMPVTNWGKTVVERPTFWFYVPYSAQEVRSGEFVLYKQDGNNPNKVYKVYQTSFTLPEKPGLVSFTIPPTQAPLEINQWYRWDFQLNCAPPSSASDLVQGWVQRVELTPELERQLKTATGREYDVYTRNLIWYDAIARLVQLRLTQRTNNTLDNYWTYLLSLKGIEGSDLDPEKLKQEPIIGSVLVQPTISYSPVSHP